MDGIKCRHNRIPTDCPFCLNAPQKVDWVLLRILFWLGLVIMELSVAWTPAIVYRVVSEGGHAWWFALVADVTLLGVGYFFCKDATEDAVWWRKYYDEPGR